MLLCSTTLGRSDSFLAGSKNTQRGALTQSAGVEGREPPPQKEGKSEELRPLQKVTGASVTILFVVLFSASQLKVFRTQERHLGRQLGPEKRKALSWLLLARPPVQYRCLGGRLAQHRTCGPLPLSSKSRCMYIQPYSTVSCVLLCVCHFPGQVL